MTDEKQKAPKSIKRTIIEWIEAVVIAVLIAGFLSHFILISAIVPTGSMENTIMAGDRLIGFRFSYWFGGPERGDIIIFDSTLYEDKLIKRVIGLPGETVEIRDAHVHINGSDVPLDEPYLKEAWLHNNDGYRFEVPDGCYLVLGDNRNNSLDARFWTSDAFMLGKADNEEEAQSFTFVKKEDIIGKAIFKYYRSFDLLTK